MHWQATQRPHESYKVFVHLFEPASEALAAQVDAIPRDWTYPTDWWEAGETVSDVMALSLAEVPPGHYRIAVGMYASESGARLRVMGTADQNIGDKLEDLQRREHSLRQEAITSELLDVVTGSEAILGDVSR